MEFCGIDLHSNNSVVLIIDEADKVLYGKRLPNSLAEILSALAPHREVLKAVVVESTYNWYWLVDGLMEAGYEVKLANPGAMSPYEGLKYSGDFRDAHQLAHLLRLGILPEGHIMPKADRAVRDLARKRMQLVRSRTTQVLAVENLFARNLGSRPNSDAVKRMKDADIDVLALPEEVGVAIKANLAVIGTLNAQIDGLEKRLLGKVSKRSEFKLLKSVPGIGDVLALVICLELGNIERFAEVGNFSSYCRCVDSQYVSNGKKKGQGNVKNGNKYLAWAFIEAAHFALRFCPQAKRFYQRKLAKTNKIVAAKALAHKLARACYHMLREGKPFAPERCFV
jgi:transposase